MISKNQLKWVRLLEQKKHRLREGVFVAEGPKVVGDLLKAGHQARLLLATREWMELTGMEAQEVTADELRRASFLQHPQQVLGVFELPDSRQAGATMVDTTQLCLALDGVQDPGNLGTIIRVADWFGISDIYCSEDTADAWSPKVVQATMGSIARVRLHYTSLTALIGTLPPSYPVYGTLLDGQDIYQQELEPLGLIVMGNEGNGISAEVRQKVNRRLLIPDFHQGETADSLNVAIATAIVCSEFRRRGQNL